MRRVASAILCAGLLATGCGEDAPDTEWEESEVIEAAGLREDDFHDGLVLGETIDDAKCTVEAVATNNDEVSQLDEQTNVSVAVNDDETAGVSVRNIVDEGESLDSPDYVLQEDEDECVAEIEEGLAELTEEG